MTKELARYFVTVIDRDLYFLFNGMGIPSGICEWLEDQLIQEKFDEVEEFIKLRYDEQNKKRIKKKRKFKFMTVKEYCKKTECQNCERCYNMFYDKSRPYKTKDGKYVLIKVKE